ncbi:arylsulfatase B-like [Hyalella azteca]|uniref:Arylsulfatase B-like n=1 Tax=Hyalella azteca TaxID=294128 RepID=A0A8B7N6J7_HYAAZ|nr:arylsulfatase B-like [Hyalella azteca]
MAETNISETNISETNISDENISERNISQPHIVFILVDDLGYNDVSWHNEAVYMPNIQRLAETGIILDGSYTQPVCTPTRAALLTGRYPHTIGRQGGALESLQPTGLDLTLPLLPTTLREAGYSTHMVGKWHLGFCNESYTPTHRGFDTFYGFYGSGQNYYTRYTNNQYHFNGKQQQVQGYDRRKQMDVHRGATGVYSTFEFAEEAASLIRSHDPQKPMFLLLATQAVHGPTQVPDTYSDMYPMVADKRRKKFLGMVSALDDAVAYVVDALKDSELYNNTIIVFTTDNGGSPKAGGSNWPLRGYKHTLYEGGVRGAAFVHSPLLKQRGIINNRLFHVVDWYPTLAGVANATTPPDLDGVDQWGSLNLLAPPPRNNTITITKIEPYIRASVRSGNLKLLVGELSCHKSVPSSEDVDLLRPFHHVLDLTRRLLESDEGGDVWSSLQARHLVSCGGLTDRCLFIAELVDVDFNLK